jgi:hypothetical protein
MVRLKTIFGCKMRKTSAINITTTINDVKALAHTVIYSGCYNNCEGCHNMFLKVKQEGMTLTHIENELKKRRKLTDIIVHAGAEPLHSPLDLLRISEIASKYNYTQVLFSGSEPDDLLFLSPKYIRYIDYIKIGSYQINNKVEGYHFASANQALYRVEYGYIMNKIYFVDNNEVKGDLPFV